MNKGDCDVTKYFTNIDLPVYAASLRGPSTPSMAMHGAYVVCEGSSAAFASY